MVQIYGNHWGPARSRGGVALGRYHQLGKDDNKELLMGASIMSVVIDTGQLGYCTFKRACRMPEG